MRTTAPFARPSGKFRLWCTAILIAACSAAPKPAPPPAASPAAAPGPLPGSLGENVKLDADGAFTQRIPIEVPPGINGVEPDLSLGYDSQAGNGILGMGWSLAGLASIERTPRIRAIDGINGAVAYDAGDRFALAGERLIAIGGANGAAGSTYRTEVESWHRVVANGQAGSGPASFTVTARSGVQMTFGDSADSAPTAGGLPDVQSWCLHTVTDLHGNSWEVTYTQDPLASGVPDYRCYPSRIDYTANAGAGQAANRSVRFLYEARPDHPVTYRGGAPLGLSARLANIETYVGDAIVGNYELDYEESPSTGRSRLIAVTRRASDAPNAAALSPATFSYSDSGQKFGVEQTWLAGAFSKSQGYDGHTSFFTLAEVNGDGFSDIVGFSSGSGVQVALGGATAFQPARQWIDDFTASQGWQAEEPRLLADVNGDGLADIVGFSSEGVETAISTGAGFQKVAGELAYFSPTQGWGSGSPRMLQDANGDQLLDIIGVLEGTVHVALGQRSGSFAEQETWLTGFGSASDTYQVADMNGDGNADLIDIDAKFATTVALSTAGAFTLTGWTQGDSTLCGNQPQSGTPIFVSDANGDGLGDFIAFCNSANPAGAYVSLSTGKSLVAAALWNTTFAGNGWSSANLRLAADLNGDAMVDLVGVTASEVIAALSTDQAFAAGDWNQSSLTWGLSSDPASTRFMVDADGDGLMDMVGIGGTDVKVSTAAGPYPDLLIRAVRAAGASYSVAYAPLSDSEVYREAKPEALAQFQNFPPLSDPNGSLPQLRSGGRLGGNYHVVKAIAVDDNPAVGATAFHYQNTFFYEDGLLDENGRGWLGFARQTQDSQTGAGRRIREYRQDFPFIGKLGQGHLLDPQKPGCGAAPFPYTSAWLSYAKRQTATASDGSGAPVYFPYVAERLAGAYEQCAVANRVGSRFSYDDYGNPAVVSRLGLVDPNGADLDPGDNVYFLTQYLNDAEAWRLGYPQYKKVSASSSLENLGAFEEGVDFSLRSWTYDGEMSPLTQQAWDDQNQVFIGYAYTYNDFGLVRTRTSPTGSVRTTTYESTYNTYPQSVTQTTSPTSSLTYGFGYDPRFGLQSVAVDPNRVGTNTCFDAFGRKVASQGLYPDARTEGSFDSACVSPLLAGAPAAPNVVTLRQLQYGWQGALPTVTATLLAEWPTGEERATFELERTQDGLWRESTTTLLAGDPLVLRQLAYAERNRVLRSALPYAAGKPASYAVTRYDVAGRPTLTEVPTGPTGEQLLVNTFAYAATATGGKVTQTTAPGTDAEIEQILTYGFVANRLRVLHSEIVGLPGSTDYTYYPEGHGKSLTAPAGQDGSRPQWTRTYDSLGRTATLTSPAGGTTRWRYAPNGLLSSRSQGSGSFRYTRDLLGRLQIAEGSDGTRRTLTWDGPTDAFGQGRLESGEVAAGGDRSKAANHTGYTYDSTGRIATQTLKLALAPEAYEVTRSWDPQGRMIEILHPDGSRMQRTYDGLQLSSASLDEASAAFSDYAPSGFPQTITYGNGTSLTSAFTVDGLLLSQLVEDPGGAALLSQQYQWDEAGRLAAIEDGSTGNPAWSYEYQALRLVEAAAGDDSESWPLAYDGAGNLTRYGDLAYQYTGTLAETGTGDGGFAAGYGPMGQLRDLRIGSGPASTFAYDASNRLVAAKAGEDPSPGSEYVYDHTGRRVAALLPGGELTIFVAPSYRDVRSPDGQSRPLRLLETFGQVQAQWGTETGDLSRFYLHADHQRSTLLTTGAAGQALTRLAYTPQGAIRAGDPGGLRFRYTGLEQDSYTGFYHLGAREYHPGIARFNSPDDRLGGPASLGDSANDMAYVLNSPAMYLDPTGHSAASAGCGAAIALGGAAVAFGKEFNIQNKAWNYTGLVLAVGGAACGVLNFGKEVYDDYFAPAEGAADGDEQADDVAGGQELDELGAETDSVSAGSDQDGEDVVADQDSENPGDSAGSEEAASSGEELSDSEAEGAEVLPDIETIFGDFLRGLEDVGEFAEDNPELFIE